ncbi:MAG TPA: hypothetical protein G4O02_13300 [Caldilineae bacterium]|nr:hypothetical protein [Caldilineae bacterium]
MSEYWEGTPDFTAGQILSAGGHLNALARAVRYLFGLEVMSTIPFSGVDHEGVSASPIWQGYIRHKKDTFAYSFTLHAASGHTAYGRIYYNGQMIVEHSLTDGATQTFTGTVDLSTLGLTVGQFYPIEVYLQGTQGLPPNWPYLHLHYLRETYTPSYPTLAAFNDGDTPTAAQWQALSDYAEELYNVLTYPRVPFAARKSGPDIWQGGIKHRVRYLLYQIRLKKAHKGSGLTCRVYVNGVQQDTVNIDVDTPTRTPENRNDYEFQDKYRPYLVQFDLNPLGLPIGDDYTLAFDLSSGEDPWLDAQLPKAVLDFAYEVPEASPSFAGWNDLPEWEHGDYIYGSTTTKQVQDIKENLEWLGSRACYANMPCRLALHPYGFRFVRLHRWLHYKAAEGKQPRLGYYVDRWREVTLPVEEGVDWMVYDLDGADHLYPGTRYLVTDADHAIEDVGY